MTKRHIFKYRKYYRIRDEDRLRFSLSKSVLKIARKTRKTILTNRQGLAWPGIHFLLIGDPWGGEPPLKYVVLGGEALGEEEFGYGPPQYITPEQIIETAKSLSEVSINELRKRYNPDRFFDEEIYPKIWDEG
ncbi:MAG TPA: hypothetical protein DCK76_02040 [Desulfotomaculum sp.]|nr:MAG: Uncharacterized protein XD84_2030 [Desulfotomaculum sp. 46_80]HAG10180.1 hypothetical protein [Desulfotomaculum sp.]HBY03079.1 hypothetical protein [Desulfotomaculum sp.]